MTNLFIDVETYSSVDIKKSGLYKYIQSPDFEIIILSYVFDDGDIVSIDLLSGQEIPDEFIFALNDENVLKVAHNATFERLCFNRIGLVTDISQWFCTAIKAAYCGLPLRLDDVAKILGVETQKLATGKALIKFFSCPVKPTRTNGYQERNYPEINIQKWEQYKQYNINDTGAERDIFHALDKYPIPEFERALYILDQQINDLGIQIDLDFATAATEIENIYSTYIHDKVKTITGLENPNSVAQLKQWIYFKTGKNVAALTKESVPILMKDFINNPDVHYVLSAREKTSKSSIKKYHAMINCSMDDSRTRGLFQFYGANRTGRWAGRLVQLQNLTKNHIENIDLARMLIRNRDVEALEIVYDDVNDILSQVIRTAFVPKPNHIFGVADFAAIEARATSWLADEDWRLEVFRGDGKIYEAAAARMFNVPISLVTKGSDLRAKAKNAELALGYQGSLGAMKRMGGEKMGMSDAEMMSIVNKWRAANPKIVKMWDTINDDAMMAVMYQIEVTSEIKGIKFNSDGFVFTITLPSGHVLHYFNPQISSNRFGSKCITYEGVIQETKKWGRIETYGGKLTENIIQALSRDILGDSMLRLRNNSYNIVMHVHDEVICEMPEHDDLINIENMCSIMGEDISWAPGLPLKAEGFVSNYYKKD